MDMFNKLYKLITQLYPPPAWRPVVIITLGVFTGLGLFILYISNAFSYLSDEPSTCMNCHVMTPQYATWERSSHREVAVCNDCHVPQNNVFSKYSFKAQDGMRHATIFTMRWEPQVIRIKDAGRAAVQDNCIRCHIDLIGNLTVGGINQESHTARLDKRCVDCHQETPHGIVNSLASTPYARVPRLSPVVPDWISKMTKSSNVHK
jgi:cytochrome c nitrite reductase small subunit